MGRFKESIIEETTNQIIKRFRNKDELPNRLKEYLSSQGFFFRSSGYEFIEKRLVTTDNLFFIGQMNYYSNFLTYIITNVDSNKKMIIKTDTKYSFFEMNKNTFLDEEY